MTIYASRPRRGDWIHCIENKWYFQKQGRCGARPAPSGRHGGIPWLHGIARMGTYCRPTAFL